MTLHSKHMLCAASQPYPRHCSRFTSTLVARLPAGPHQRPECIRGPRAAGWSREVRCGGSDAGSWSLLLVAAVRKAWHGMHGLADATICICRYETMIVLRPDMTDEERRALPQHMFSTIRFGRGIVRRRGANLTSLYVQGQ